jgi:N-acetylglucosamine kinase-like BadF-type ATPase
MSAATILAIDGGGSKTLVALADASGDVTRLAAGAGSNPMDNPHWRDTLATTAAEILPERQALAAAAVALPAYGEVMAISAAQHEVMRRLLGDVPQHLLNDVDAAHYGAFAGGPGILILSGTGSMAWARDTAGDSFRVGGWGEGFGDEGSGYWIGLRAVTLASHDLDGRAPAPGLVEGLFAGLGLDRTTPQDSLAGWFAALPHRRSAIAALAPLVDRLAAAGDPTARAIIDEAAAHLALHVTTIARRIDAAAAARWSFAGGTFGSRLLLDGVARHVGTPPLAPRLPPIGGALLLAARDAGWPADTAWIDRLAVSLGAARMAAQPTINQGEQGHAWTNHSLGDRAGGGRVGSSGSGR